MLNRLGAIFLVLLMSFSNVGFAVSTHFCGGYAVETVLSIGEAHLGCGMESETDFCASTSIDAYLKPIPCCEDKAHFVAVNDNLKTSRVDVPTQSNKTWAISVPLFLIGSNSVIRTHLAFFDVPPPPDIHQDKQVLFQTFLI